MGNKIEVVDGVKGEWRSVTKANEVTVGQRVRYGGDDVGYYDEKRFVMEIDAIKSAVRVGDGETVLDGDLFGENKPWNGTVQALFHIAEKKPRKVAKVDVGYYFSDGHFSEGWQWYLASSKMVEIHSARNYTTRAHAIRGARRFCKTIGFECEIVK